MEQEFGGEGTKEVDASDGVMRRMRRARLMGNE